MRFCRRARAAQGGLAKPTAVCLVLTALTSFYGNPAIGQAQLPVGQDSQRPSEKAKPEPPLRPGKDRWAVKTAADPGARQIKSSRIKTTVEKMLMLSRPKELPLDSTPPEFQERRAGPVENSVYSVDAEIKEFRLIPDGDYRVVIEGASGKSMVLELPNPDPMFVNPDGPFAYAIRAARERFDQKFHPVRTTTHVSAHARITGLGFFGRQYGQKFPLNGNLIQLHPVLDIEWLNSPSKEFIEATKKPKQRTTDQEHKQDANKAEPSPRIH